MSARRRFREAFRYYGFVLIGAVLAALLVVAVVNAIRRAEIAETARATTSAKATRRIDALNARITVLTAQAIQNGQTIGQLQADIAALAEQIRQMGGAPVVVAQVTEGRPAAGSSGKASPAPESGTTTTSTSTPPPTTTTTPTTTAPPTTSPPSPEPQPADGVCAVLAVPLLCR